jgi:hypothetical protein
MAQNTTGAHAMTKKSKKNKKNKKSKKRKRWKMIRHIQNKIRDIYEQELEPKSATELQSILDASLAEYNTLYDQYISIDYCETIAEVERSMMITYNLERLMIIIKICQNNLPTEQL